MEKYFAIFYKKYLQKTLIPYIEHHLQPWVAKKHSVIYGLQLLILIHFWYQIKEVFYMNFSEKLLMLRKSNSNSNFYLHEAYK